MLRLAVRDLLRRRLTILSLALKIVVLPCHAIIAGAQTLGMVIDDAGDMATVFDAETHSVLGTVAVGPGFVGDCSITPDETLGFVTDFAYRVWVVDLAASPPALAQPDPIAISNAGEDTSLSADGRFLVVCDGFATEPISVVDVATRTEVSTFSLGSNCNSVDVCADGSVLVASTGTGNVHRLTLDAFGHLTDTKEKLFTGSIGFQGPNNVFCSIDGQSGLVVGRTQPAKMLSFTVPGLAVMSQRTLSGSGIGISGEVAAAGLVAARSDGGAVDVFDFDPGAATLGLAPVYSIPLGPAITYFGVDQLALDPWHERMYVSNGAALDVYELASGALLDTITDPAIAAPTGVCFARGPRAPEPACGDGTVDEGEECDDGNVDDGDGCSAACEHENRLPDCSGAKPTLPLLWPANGQLAVLGVSGVVDPDGDGVSISVTSVHQDEAPGKLRKGTCPAAFTLGGASVAVIADRDTSGDGRVYHVGFTADDGRGGGCGGTVRVCIPRTGKSTSCGDQGPRVDSTATCGELASFSR